MTKAGSTEVLDKVTEDLFEALEDVQAVRERRRIQEEEIGDLDEYLEEAVENPEKIKMRDWWSPDGPQLYMALKHINHAKEIIEEELEGDPKTEDV